MLINHKKLMSVSREPYINHIQEIVKMLNQHLAKFEIEVFCLHPTDKIDFLTCKRLIEKSIEILHYPQIKAMVEIIECLVKKNEEKKSEYDWIFVPKPVAITALTQSGKTMLTLLGVMISLIIYLLTGELTFVHRFLTNHLDLYQQAEDDGKDFADLYQNIRFSHKKNESTEISVWDYKDQLNCKLVNDGCPDLFLKIIGNGFRTGLSEITKWDKEYKLLDRKVIVFCDESGHRSDTDSVLDKMNKMHGLVKNVAYLALSATNDAFVLYCKEHGFPVIDMLPGGVQLDDDPSPPQCQPLYTGYPWQNGKKLKNLIVPRVMSISEASEEFGFDIDIPIGKLSSLLRVNQHTPANSEILKRSKAKNKWINNFAGFINQLLIVKNPLKAKGMLVRIISHNDSMLSLKKELQDLTPSVKIMLYAADEKNEKGEKLEKYVSAECGREGKRRCPYVVIVTGSGRMGTQAPKDCKYGMDFTDKSEPNTLQQGIAGRMSGYNKGKTWVILSKNNSDLLKQYIDIGKWQKKDKRGNYIEQSPVPRHIGRSTDSSLSIYRNEIELGLTKEIEKEIKNIAKVRYVGDFGEQKIFRKLTGECFPWDLFSTIIQKLEEDNEDKGASILPPDEHKDFLMNNGNIPVAIRLATDLDSSFTNRDSQGKNRIHPAIIVDRNMEVQAIRFRLTYNIEKNGLKKMSMYAGRQT